MKKRAFLFFTVFLIALAPTLFAWGGKKNKETLAELEALKKKVELSSQAGDLQAAIEAAEDVLALTAREFGAQSIEAGEAMNNTASLYLLSGGALNAERLYKEAILILAAKKDKYSLEMADYYYNLGMAYAMQEKYDQASSILNQCLQIRAKELGQKHPETQKVQNSLADVWEQQKKLPV